MMGMLVPRFATVLAIAVWIGGLLALGAIAAPAIFEVVSLRQVPDGRMLSGAIFGEVLRRFHLVSYGCGAVIVIALFVRAVLGPRPRRFSIRLGIAVLMLGATMYSGMVLSTADRACAARDRRAASPRRASRPAIPVASRSAGCTASRSSSSWCR